MTEMSCDGDDPIARRTARCCACAPARAVDAGLPQRVARGLGGVWEARQIEGLMAWMQRCERALAWVAVHGDRDSAMLARRVLAGDWDDGTARCLGRITHPTIEEINRFSHSK